MTTAKAALLLTPEELRVEGFRVLSRGLGPAAALRFVLEYERGRGDYSSERHDLIDHLTVEQVEGLVEQMGHERPRRPRSGARRVVVSSRRTKGG